MKRTLVDIVNEILLSLDSETVDSINDTVESRQVAEIVRNTYETLFTTGQLPEHKEFFTLEPLSDLNRPTHFLLPDNVLRVDTIWYNVEPDNTKPYDYREIEYLDPIEFLAKTDKYDGAFVEAPDAIAGTKLRIRTDKFPEFYTSFDDKHIVMDSVDKTVEDTLLATKTRVYGTREPSWESRDDFIPDIDTNLFPVLVNEAKSVAAEQLKGIILNKVEQHARHSRHLTQNDYSFRGRRGIWRNYGRSL